MSERDETGSADATDDGADEIIGFEIDDPTGRRGLLGWVAALAAFVLALGLIPAKLGFGPFGLRLFTSDEIPVHVLNLSGSDLEVALSFASPVVVTGGTMETLVTLSGSSSLRATRPDGTLVDDLEFEAAGPLFYNAGGGRCFAVFDISAYYDGELEEGDMTVVARLDEDTRLYEFEADTIVLPRRMAPDQARGVVHWLEPVGCSMLDPENESYLVGTSLVRLQQRRERYEEELRRAREAQGGE